MEPFQWIIVIALTALALCGSAAVGWALGRRAGHQKPKKMKPARRKVPTPARVDQLVDLGELSRLLDRSDVLIISTVTIGVAARAEIIDTAVIDTTTATRLNCPNAQTGSIPTENTIAQELTIDRLRKLNIRQWPSIYSDIEELITTATIVVSYNASLHRRMLSQTAERHGLKRLPTADWGCLMRRYTESTAGPGSRWINLAEATTRENIANTGTKRAVDDARAALELLRIMARREKTEHKQSV